MTTITMLLTITGLRCNGCSGKLQKRLNKITGVSSMVNFTLGQVALSLSERHLLADVLSCITAGGYQYQLEKQIFQVTGWSCGGCAKKTKNLLMQHPGVIDVQANAATSLLEVEYVAGGLKHSELATICSQLGYQLQLVASDKLARQEQVEREFSAQNKQRLKQLLVACLFTLPLVLPMLLMLFGITLLLNPWLEFALASVVQFYVGAKYYRGAWLSLKSFSSNMDTLVALGTSAAYFYSCYLLFVDWQAAHGKLYFEASAVIITFVSIGKWLEHRAKHQTSEAIRHLMALTPITANVLRDNQVLNVALEQVLMGDIVRVIAGEKIPVDGMVVSGESEIDESLITGESLPLRKTIDDKVYAGSVNSYGVLTIEAQAVGENSSLSQIIKMVGQAQMKKAPIERLVDKVAAIFVPSVLLIAVITGITWTLLGASFEVALINSVAVLVVACPCALGLATPAAMVVGSGAAAKQGIIIRDPAALQVASNLQRIAFDKTGTLTHGKPQVVNEVFFSAEPVLVKTQLLALMQQSEHPLAKAIIKANNSENEALTQVKNFQVIAGHGVIGELGGLKLVAGNLQLMAQHSVVIEQKYKEHSIYSEIYFAVDGVLLGLIQLSDQPRENSAQAIEQLKQRGVLTTMLSGDHQHAADHIAAKLGLDDVQAGLKPQQKLQQLSLWQQQGERVAMVGDGINDAPALAQADLGIAMGSGSQVAISSAQITLVKSDPLLVVAAIDIASATWRKIKQNLFLAFIFNALAIPLAAMGYLSPQLAGLAMALSSITVLTNALLLKRWRVRREQ